MKVFFYGSLMQKFAKRILPSSSLRYIKDDVIDGVMYDLGRFPAILEGDGDVKGEVFEVLEADVIRELDRFEGYDEDHPSRSFYRREEVTTRSGEIVQVYIFNQPIPDSTTKVRDGDWFNHCKGVNKI